MLHNITFIQFYINKSTIQYIRNSEESHLCLSVSQCRITVLVFYLPFFHCNRPMDMLFSDETQYYRVGGQLGYQPLYHQELHHSPSFSWVPSHIPVLVESQASLQHRISSCWFYLWVSVQMLLDLPERLPTKIINMFIVNYGVSLVVKKWQEH